MICVIATIELHPGTRAEFLDHFRSLVPLVRQEAGCLEYGPLVDLPTHLTLQPEPRTEVVTVLEKWASVASLEAHLVAPHMRDYRARVSELVKGVTLRILEPA